MTNAIGTPLPRIEGPDKVGGHASYAGDVQLPNLAFGALVCSTISKGRIVAIDASLASAQPGVLKIITYQNCPKFNQPAKPVSSRGQSLLPLQQPDIAYYGEHVAVVVAESFEAAAAAANLLSVTYAASNAPLTFAAEASAQKVKSGAHEIRWGDAAGAFTRAPIKIEQRYRTPYMHHNPIEPPTTTASWDGEQLTLHDGTQWLAGVRDMVAATLGIAPANVRVVSPYVGGSFGAKRLAWPHVYLAAIVAKIVGRPVRLTLTRAQMYSTIGYRPQTVQQVKLGAKRNGQLVSFQHAGTSTTSKFDNVFEPASAKTGMMYACPNGKLTRELAKVDLGTPTTMRAPGESTGFFALECAMDELAYAAKIDPLKLRLINHADTDPTSHRPWSSKSLKQCYTEGAAKFGWNKRKPIPGSMRDGNWMVGWGMASSAYPANRSPASASVELFADGHSVVASATHEMGGGTYTALAIVAADALGLDVAKVRVELGDSTLPMTTVSGGSRTINSVTPAVEAAAMQVIDKLAALAIADPQSPLRGADPSQIIAAGGSLRLLNQISRADPLTEILARHRLPSLKMSARTAPAADAAKYSQFAFGAHFAEVRVDGDLGEVRVSRYVAAFAAGRIINPLTARSQVIGAIVGGIGMALLEESTVDTNIGCFVARDLVEYRVPVHADIPPIEIILVPEHDTVTNPIGTKGIGELGIVGAAAAIANAVFHATSKRIRDLPITPDKLLNPNPGRRGAIAGVKPA